MALTRDQVRHIALLARLELTAEEEISMLDQLGNILEYIEKLQELDTSAVQPTAHVTELPTPFRDDRAVNTPDVANLLRNAPERDGDFFKVPKIIE